MSGSSRHASTASSSAHCGESQSPDPKLALDPDPYPYPDPLYSMSSMTSDPALSDGVLGLYTGITVEWSWWRNEMWGNETML